MLTRNYYRSEILTIPDMLPLTFMNGYFRYKHKNVPSYIYLFGIATQGSNFNFNTRHRDDNHTDRARLHLTDKIICLENWYIPRCNIEQNRHTYLGEICTCCQNYLWNIILPIALKLIVISVSVVTYFKSNHIHISLFESFTSLSLCVILRYITEQSPRRVSSRLSKQLSQAR